MHGACVRQAQQACSRRPLVCLAKDRRGIPQRKVEPVTFTRSDSMDLTKSLQHCSTWRQVQVLYQRHRDLPLHPINRAAFFTRLQYVLQQQATAAKHARHSMSHGGSAGSSTEQPRRSAVATDPQPLLRTLPATERQAVEQICGTWALDIGNAIDGIGGKELSIIAKSAAAVGILHPWLWDAVEQRSLQLMLCQPVHLARDGRAEDPEAGGMSNASLIRLCCATAKAVELQRRQHNSQERNSRQQHSCDATAETAGRTARYGFLRAWAGPSVQWRQQVLIATEERLRQAWQEVPDRQVAQSLPQGRAAVGQVHLAAEGWRAVATTANASPATDMELDAQRLVELVNAVAQLVPSPHGVVPASAASEAHVALLSNWLQAWCKLSQPALASMGIGQLNRIAIAVHLLLSQHSTARLDRGQGQGKAAADSAAHVPPSADQQQGPRLRLPRSWLRNFYRASDPVLRGMSLAQLINCIELWHVADHPPPPTAWTDAVVAACMAHVQRRKRTLGMLAVLPRLVAALACLVEAERSPHEGQSQAQASAVDQRLAAVLQPLRALLSTSVGKKFLAFRPSHKAAAEALGVCPVPKAPDASS